MNEGDDMSRVLIITWDGAGNLLSTLGIAQRLAEQGHDVRLLGHRSINDRCSEDGWRFRPFQHTQEYDAFPPVTPEAEFEVMSEHLWFNSAVARDLADELAAEPADAVVVDCMLFAALCQAEAAGVPTAALFHAPYSGFRGGPMVEMLAPGIAKVNALRAELGLAPIRALADLHDACALSLVATPREYDVDMPVPANVRFIGPVLDGPHVAKPMGTVETEDGPDPLVVVSLSTSPQGQLPVLQRLVDALGGLPVRVVVTTGPAIDPALVVAPANAQVVQFVAHEDVFAAASLVVTHAGLGTVMTALSQGLPMVCLPMGRDQFFNAMRVEALGAGRTLPADAERSVIAEAVSALLADDSVRAGAKRMASVIASYGGATDAVREVEAITG
jgi:MGT family glycosyltransferase